MNDTVVYIYNAKIARNMDIWYRKNICIGYKAQKMEKIDGNGLRMHNTNSK